MEFLVIGLIFLILLLLMVWRPFFKQKTHVIIAVDSVRDETNVRLYHEHKKEIEKDYSEGGIDEENYQYLLSELNSTLLQDIDNSSKADATKQSNAASSSKAYSPFWPLGLSVFIIIFSVALYNKQGSYELLTEMPAGHGQMSQDAMAKEQMSQEQMLKERQAEAQAYIEKLKEHIEANPTDTEAWYNLGQTYVAIGDFDEAVEAFSIVIKIEGEHADLLGAIAQALYYKNNQQINQQVQSYIDRSLALDINDPSTNILLGMHNFINGNYQQSIDYWQRVINANKQGVNIAALKEAVAESRSRLGSSASSSSVNNASTNNGSATSTAPNAEVNNQDTPGTGPQLKISVTLSDEVAQQLAQGEDRVVFIYAVPTNGQRMPLAAVKMKASDLPANVVLNNSQAMIPTNTLGSVEQANVYAIVSKSGGVGIKPGDFKAEALSVDVNTTETINLTIDSLVE